MNLTELKMETWPIEKLIPYARNPRKNDEQVARMVAAIKEFGFRIPIVAKSDGAIVDGHLRLKAALKLGLTEVPVVLADELTEAQIKAFRILANQSANWAEWDKDLLKLELLELKELDFDLALTGFDGKELSEWLNEDEQEDNKYTNKVATPIYEPTGEYVDLSDCVTQDKTKELLNKIEASGLDENEKSFLRIAATRHYCFNYQNIAEYYANATQEMKRLMEDSALVIIDYDKAIESGYVEMSEAMRMLIGAKHDAA